MSEPRCDVCGQLADFAIHAQWTIVDFGTWWACWEHAPNVVGKRALEDRDGARCVSIELERLYLRRTAATGPRGTA